MCYGELAGPVYNNNQLVTGCYDKGGNMLGNNACPSLPYTPTYYYDAENRLRTTAGINYIYDGDGNRVEKSNGTLYWGSGPLAESDLSGNMQREYIFFNDKTDCPPRCFDQRCALLLLRPSGFNQRDYGRGSGR